MTPRKNLVLSAKAEKVNRHTDHNKSGTLKKAPFSHFGPELQI
jgi:hypothetical protein